MVSFSGAENESSGAVAKWTIFSRMHNKKKLRLVLFTIDQALQSNGDIRFWRRMRKSDIVCYDNVRRHLS